MAALKYYKKWAAVRGSSFPLQCISNTVQNSWQHVSVFLTEGTYCFLGRKSNSEALTLGKPIKQAHEHKPVNQVFPRMKLLKSHSPALKLLAEMDTIGLWKKDDYVTSWSKSATRKPEASCFTPLYISLKVEWENDYFHFSGMWLSHRS